MAPEPPASGDPRGARPEGPALDRGFAPGVPRIALPKGGGAVRGMGEKFGTDPVTGTGSFAVPLPLSPGRAGFGPRLSLSYDSGAGNGIFGMGWSLSLPQITRKTDKGVPRYGDGGAEDVFQLSGAEDLVPELRPDGGPVRSRTGGFTVDRYRPRVEGAFSRIERWTHDGTGVAHWRVLSADNVLTVYGGDEESRVHDPEDPARVFGWLICEQRDDRGQAMLYEYQREDGRNVDLSQVHERNRGDRDSPLRCAARHPKRIRYGNREPLLDSRGTRPRFLSEEQRGATRWMFEVVLDYGDHNADAPLPREPDAVWDARPDPFSGYRAGFEVRTYRRCRRVLMFHHFPEDPEVGPDCLVSSTDFTYGLPESTEDALGPVYSFLTRITQRGYRRSGSGYRASELPPLDLEYSAPLIDETVRTVGPAADGTPVGPVDGHRTQWVDLDGEGLTGLLAEVGGAWYYRRNTGPLPPDSATGAIGEGGPAVGAPGPRFAGGAVEARTPVAPGLASGPRQLLDTAGDGQLDLAAFAGPVPGYYERTGPRGWEPFRPFASLPVLDWSDPRLRFGDLSGDGRTDLLSAEDDALAWYESLGEDGFAPARRVPLPLDEERGPQLLFTDPRQSVALVDLSGDGLSDLVRVRNGEVCYWPNLGYGRFGPKVTMDDSPVLDAPDLFDAARVRFADVDGSGTTDLLYLTGDGVTLHFNQSGNAWSGPRRLRGLPRFDGQVSFSVLDLLGSGTACLVWSSPHPADGHAPLRYVDLMGGRKPHLLTAFTNNIGARTEIAYTPSTAYYLQDLRAGRPWLSPLPFPVHCVSRITVTDRWRGTSFSTTHTYHHGHFDPEEREFRGFGRVERVDTESFRTFAGANAEGPFTTTDRNLYQPPVKTVTWYDTGAGGPGPSPYSAEFFPGTRTGAFHEPQPVSDTEPTGLDGEELRQAARARKGTTVRQETYELSPHALERGEQRPVRLMSAVSNGSRVRCLQRRGPNRHAVFLVAPGESVATAYELDLRDSPLRPDPRVSHTLPLRFDAYGHVLQSLTAVYPRTGRFEDDGLDPVTVGLVREVQDELHLSYTETRFTKDTPDPEGAASDPAAPDPDPDEGEPDDGDPDGGEDHHRNPLPCETLTYDVTGVTPRRGRHFTTAELLGLALSSVHQQPDPELTPVPDLPYHRTASGDEPRKRLVEHRRTLFTDDAVPGMERPAPLRILPRLALPYEEYRLALTEDLLTAVLGDRFTQEVRGLLEDKGAAGYTGGGRLADLFPAGEEGGRFWLGSGRSGYAPDAARHFYLPDRYTDPFGNVSTLVYDALDLFVESSADAAGNTTRVLRFDFRTLVPGAVLDPNDNVSETAFDVLGRPVAVAARGKGSEGDDLGLLTPDLADPPPDELEAFFAGAALDETAARRWLGNATARYVHHFGQRAAPDGTVLWGQEPPCVCSLLREEHTRSLAVGELSALSVSFAYSDSLGGVLSTKSLAEPDGPGLPPRWLASGRTVVNNKANPVLHYEPYFSDPATGHRFEEPRQEGVTSVTHYDALGRTVRVEEADGTFSRVEFSPWHVLAYDPNDTASEPGNAWFARRTAPGATAAERRTAELTAVHAGTPALTLLDSRGREVLAVAHNRWREDGGAVREEKYATYTKLDAEGRPLWTRDARGNLITQLIRPPKPVRRADEPDPAHPERIPADSAPCYDVAGNLLSEHGMDSGDRWRLTDASGQTLLAWDPGDRHADDGGTPVPEERRTRTVYDALRRPVEHWLSVDDGPPAMIARYEYLDAGGADGPAVASAKQRNLCGRLHRHFDTAGLTVTERVDFGGRPLQVSRRLVRDHRAALTDWQGADPEALLEDERFTQIAEFDALGRERRLYNWHRGTGSRVAVHELTYGERGLLQSHELVIGAVKATGGHTEDADVRRTTVLSAARYDAQGRRSSVGHGNGTQTTYAYDRDSRRLTLIRTTHGARVLQALSYAHDPVGNVIEIRDDAYEPEFFANQRVDPVGRYTYDAVYRLMSATGRENARADGAPSHGTAPRRRADFPVTVPGALRGYTEAYEYDQVGNIERVRHAAGPTGSWTRTHTYVPDSNRLDTSTVGADGRSVTHAHDAHGNLLNFENTAPGFWLRWDHRDLLHMYDRGGGGRVYYQYDAGKQRTRKAAENAAGGRLEWSRIQLGGLEIYRRFAGGSMVEEIESVHVADGARRVLLVDDVRRTDNPRLRVGPSYRYQYENHLGSAGLELDEHAATVSYEEWHPYGTVAYEADSKAVRATAKRFRFLGKERDEETGLSLLGARYYAPWLARWITGDPSGVTGGPHLYAYADGDPVGMKDDHGRWPAAVDKFLSDAKGAAKAAGPVLLGYAETRIAALADKAALLNPVTAPLKVTEMVVEKVATEVKEVREVAAKEGKAQAALRAWSGSTSWHAGDAVAKARKSGASPWRAAEAGVAKLGEDTAQMNPLYHLGVALVGAPVAAMDALDRGDGRGAGKHLAEGQGAMEEFGQTVIPMLAEAGLFKAAPNAGGAMSGKTGGGRLKLPGVTGDLAAKVNSLASDFLDRAGIGEAERGVGEQRLKTTIGDPKRKVLDPHGPDIGRNQPGSELEGGIGLEAGVVKRVKNWKAWNSTRLPARIEAALQHEWFEFKGASHEQAVKLGRGAPFEGSEAFKEAYLPISKEARELLETMPYEELRLSRTMHPHN
ncbi:SpvB/TcaC N-terminal domain-containing protein [Streptomyces sp. NPDC033753]|uniref:SpvB/TcaC N-terminal domain-containing protein n=1 Tax=Streptomyces sp. NPDC033753 TaxID=3155128 RepID=UPI0033E11AC1